MGVVVSNIRPIEQGPYELDIVCFWSVWFVHALQCWECGQINLTSVRYLTFF